MWGGTSYEGKLTMTPREKANATFISFTSSLIDGAHWSRANKRVILDCASQLEGESDCDEIKALVAAFRLMARILNDKE